MIRYNVVSNSGCSNCDVEVDADGDYVEYAEAVAAIAAAVAAERTRLATDFDRPAAEPLESGQDSRL